MPISQEQKRYTYQDYASWDDDECWELIDGLPYNMSPAPRIKHQDISGNFFGYLYNHLEGKMCKVFHPQTDVVLSDYDVVQPDVLVVCDKTKITELNIQGAPDLIIEVLSPTTKHKDRWLKRKLYEKHAVKEYFLVDPDDETVERYALQENGRYDQSEIFDKSQTLKLTSLSGIEIPLEEMFTIE